MEQHGWSASGGARVARPAALESRLVFISGVAVVMMVAASAMAVGYELLITGGPHRPVPGAGHVTTGSTLTAGSGKVVFSDNFSDSSTGWAIDTSPTDTYQYTSQGYLVAGSGEFIRFAESPFDVPYKQLSMSVTASESAGTPNGSGFGVRCKWGSGGSEVRYEFLVLGNEWLIDRRNGPAGPQAAPLVLKEGSASPGAGVAPATVTGACATLADGQTTLLVLFIDGRQIAAITDEAALAGSGWLADFVVASTGQQQTAVTATKYEERDLSR